MKKIFKRALDCSIHNPSAMRTLLNTIFTKNRPIYAIATVRRLDYYDLLGGLSFEATLL